MPLHQPGEPHDVINVAAASLRLVGGILLLLATLGVLSIVVQFRFDDFVNSNAALMQAVARLVPYVLGGGAFLTDAYFVKRRHVWAAIVGICLTAMTALGGLVVLLALFVLLQTPRFTTPWLGVPIVLVALLTIALGLLTFDLTKAIGAIRYLNPRSSSRPRSGGFEAISSLRANALPPPPLPDQRHTIS